MRSARSRSVAVPVTVVVVVAMNAAGRVGSEDRVFAVHISHRETARMVRHTLESAVRRLERPRCEGLVDHFEDTQGRPLRASLEKAGVSGAAYLSLLVFYDGSRHPGCRLEHTFAATAVGTRIVWICPSFLRLAWRDPGTAELIVIHEALHSLGLGENPPTSSEITARVRSLCFE